MRPMTCAACPITSPSPLPSNFETAGSISIQSDEEAEIPKISDFHNFCDNWQLFGEPQDNDLTEGKAIVTFQEPGPINM